MAEVSQYGGTASRGGWQPAANGLTFRDVQIGQHVRRRRLLIGMSGSAMAAALGISEERLDSYECGRTWIDLVLLIEIAGLLRVDINFFNQDLFDHGTSTYATRTGIPGSLAESAVRSADPIFSGKMRRRWLG